MNQNEVVIRKWVTEALFYINRTKVPLVQGYVSWHWLPTGGEGTEPLSKNSFSWICPVLTGLRTDPWEAQGDLCLALFHTRGGRRAALPQTVPGRNKWWHELMPLNVSDPL